MFNNIYILKIKDKKILNKLIRWKVYFKKIKYYNNYIIGYVDYDNYLKINKYIKIYDIKLIDYKGINKIKYLLKTNLIFFISFIIGIIYLITLSNMIFSIDIMTNNNDIKKIILNELDYYGISKYHFVKSFDEKEIIKEKILNDHKDKIEWLEIDRSGTKYIINVLERVINNKNKDNEYRDLVSNKNAIIKEIRASSGEIIKKVNDYVNKGDVIVSGKITKNDEVKKYVEASGVVYGETWYNVIVNMPINYQYREYTGKSKKRLIINLFNKKIKLFNFSNYENEEIEDNIIIESKILPINLSYSNIKEIKIIDDIYTNDRVLEEGVEIAKEKLLSTLDKESKILSQKKLKLYLNNSKIYLEVFFKVYENITDYNKITVGDNNERNN